MNGVKVKLRRYKYTLQQCFMAPIHRALGKQIVHFIHPAKTGGTSVKIALMSFGCKTPTHYFCLHGHEFRLKNVPSGDIGLITVREESDRLRSVIAARKWKARNYGLIRKLWIGMTLSEEMTLKLNHTDAVHPQAWYRDDAPEKNRTVIMNTETLTEDFERIKEITNIPDWVKCGHANKGVEQ